MPESTEQNQNQEQEQIQIRQLTGKDIRMVSPAIGRAMRNLDLREMTASTEGDTEGDTESEQYKQQVGINVMSYLLENEVDALWDWIADLCGMTAEQLDQAPLETPMQVLRQVFQSGYISHFFGQALKAGR